MTDVRVDLGAFDWVPIVQSRRPWTCWLPCSGCGYQAINEPAINGWPDDARDALAGWEQSLSLPRYRCAACAAPASVEVTP